MTNNKFTSTPIDNLLTEIKSDRSLETTLNWKFDPNKCESIDIRIARDGTWFHEGQPIKRKKMCQLFSKVLRRSDDGRFFLITPVEQFQIFVEDAPFTAVELSVQSAGDQQTLIFRTNLDQTIVAGQNHPIRIVQDPITGEPKPYIVVRDKLEALILRPQFYQLVEMAEEKKMCGKTVLGVWSATKYFELGEV